MSVLILIILNLPFINTYNIHSKKSWITVFAIFVLVIILFLPIYKKRQFPKFKKTDIGILFAINIENKEEYSILNKKFVREFERMLKDVNKRYKVVLLNEFTASKFNEIVVNSEKLTRFQKKHNARFIIFGNSIWGGANEDVACTLHLESGIFHSISHENNRKFLVREMNYAFKPLRHIKILKNNETSDFEINAQQLEFAFKYILATTQLLSSEIETSINTFIALKKEVDLIKRNVPVINFIKNVVNDRICFCFNTLASFELDYFYEDNDTEHLNNVRNLLDKSDEYKQSYRSKYIRAIYYFLYNRDIKSALECLEDCQKLNRDDCKVSIAFLKLYKRDSINNLLYAYKAYNKVFSRSNVDYQWVCAIEEFIYMVLEKEPEKVQLNFLMFLIYYYIGNTELIDEYYNRFISKYSSLIDSKGLHDVLVKLGMLNIEDNPNLMVSSF